MANNCEKDQKASKLWKWANTMTKLWVVANIMAMVGIVILGLLFYSEFQIHKNKALGRIVDLQIELEVLKQGMINYDEVNELLEAFSVLWKHYQKKKIACNVFPSWNYCH